MPTTHDITLRGNQVYDCIIQDDTVVITFTDGSFITIVADNSLRYKYYPPTKEKPNG